MIAPLRSGEETHLPDKAALCRFLIDWAERTPIGLAVLPASRASTRFLSSSAPSLSPFI